MVEHIPKSALREVFEPTPRRFRLHLSEIGLGHLLPGDVLGDESFLDAFADRLRPGDLVTVIGGDFEVDLAFEGPSAARLVS